LGDFDLARGQIFENIFQNIPRGARRKNLNKYRYRAEREGKIWANIAAQRSLGWARLTLTLTLTLMFAHPPQARIELHACGYAHMPSM
jgi:hypothetical protein